MTSHTGAFVLGLDVGTSGVRAVAADRGGNVLAEAHTSISDPRPDSSIHEQDPQEWWRATCSTLKSTLKELQNVAAAHAILGVAVTSTSGSLVLTDAAGHPVRPAILYDDSRGAALGRDLRRGLPSEAADFNASYSLVKAAWVRQKEPVIWERARHLLHPADWLSGKFTGQFGTSDDSNALKLGYDPEAGSWGSAVSLLGFPKGMLPRVVRPSAWVGTVCPRASEETCLKPGTPILAGATDGMASLIASGAREPGHANTTLGTTIVWKVLARNKPRLAQGVYCHRHPCNLWAPGAASNTGPGSLRSEKAGLASSELDRTVAGYLPSSTLCYLLRSRGERFPFLNAGAEGFFEGDPATPAESYAAQLQSLAFVERWGYERLADCGVAVGPEVFSTGSAAASPAFSQLRASVLRRKVYRCHFPTSAFGAAILAASETLFGGDLKSALQDMIRVKGSDRPNPAAAEHFDRIYSSFRAACTRRGYA